LHISYRVKREGSIVSLSGKTGRPAGGRYTYRFQIAMPAEAMAARRKAGRPAGGRYVPNRRVVGPAHQRPRRNAAA
jgi:hypothetical protein